MKEESDLYLNQNDEGMNDEGMNDEGMNDEGMNDEGMNDEGMNDEGMNDDSSLHSDGIMAHSAKLQGETIVFDSKVSYDIDGTPLSS
jgi:hypothetical protein